MKHGSLILLASLYTLLLTCELLAADKDENQPAEAGDEEAAAAEGSEEILSIDEIKKEKTAEIHFDRGVEFFRDGMISAALAEFLESYSKVPRWEVLYNIGICYYRLGRYDEALEKLEQYIKEGGDGIPPDRRAAVEKLKVKMAATYGSIVIDYKEEGVRVSVDGKTTYKTPIKEPIPVSAGMHSIHMFRDGYYPVLFEVYVASGAEVVVPVEMEMTPLMEYWLTEGGGFEYLKKREKIKNMEKATWGLLGSSLVLGLATVFTGAMTYKVKEEQNDAIMKCGTPITSEDDCPEAFDLKEQGNKWKNATNGLAVTTGVFLLATLTLWIARQVTLKKALNSDRLQATSTSGIHLDVAVPGVFGIMW